MSQPRISGAVSIAGAAFVAILVLAVGAVAGAAWQSRHHDRTDMSAVDIGFAQDMSAHHDQAILMARTVSARPGVSPELRVLADRMMLAQTTETATMRGWLQWFGEPLTTDRPMSWMNTGTSTHAGHGMRGDTPPMPGLASVDELARLAQLTGRDAEIWFLQLMIRHHRGGLEMAQAAYNDDRASEATKQLAMTMISDQGDEIGQMTLMLKARNAAPMPT